MYIKILFISLIALTITPSFADDKTTVTPIKKSVKLNFDGPPCQPFPGCHEYSPKVTIMFQKKSDDIKSLKAKLEINERLQSDD